MKAYDIAVFFICLLLSVNIITASGIFGADVPVYFGPEVSLLNSSMSSADHAPQPDEKIGYVELAISSFGLLIRSLVVIIFILAYSTILLPLFLSMLYLPAPINAAITIIVWGSYIVGYAQYKGRSTLLGTE